MSLTLSVIDNQDGTATATVAGSGGALVTVYAADWPGSSFSAAGQRSGDGEVELDLACGPHWAYALTAAGYGNLTAFRISNSEQAVFARCLAAARDVIRGLSLAGLASDQVDVRKVPLDPDDMQAPRIIVSPVPETITPAWNVTDDVGYGAMITMIQASNRDPDDGTDPFLLWRERISRALRSKALPGVSEVYNVVIEPAVVVLPEAFQSMYDVGALVARCIAEELSTVA